MCANSRFSCTIWKADAFELVELHTHKTQMVAIATICTFGMAMRVFYLFIYLLKKRWNEKKDARLNYYWLMVMSVALWYVCIKLDLRYKMSTMRYEVIIFGLWVCAKARIFASLWYVIANRRARIACSFLSLFLSLRIRLNAILGPISYGLDLLVSLTLCVCLSQAQFHILCAATVHLFILYCLCIYKTERIVYLSFALDVRRDNIK